MNLWMMIGLQISKKVGRICVEEKMLPEPIELNLSILFYIKLAKITILCVEESLDQESGEFFMDGCALCFLFLFGTWDSRSSLFLLLDPYKVEIE